MSSLHIKEVFATFGLSTSKLRILLGHFIRYERFVINVKDYLKKETPIFGQA